jgi:hypothetical protein
MNSKTFFQSIEGYYGKYQRPFLRKEVADYIRGIPESELAGLYDHLKHTQTTQFGHVPDIATLEQARKEMRPSDQIGPYKKALPDPLTRGQELIPSLVWKQITDRAKEAIRKRKEAEEGTE